MHPITSATMILYSLTLQNPTLRALHGRTLLSAMSSLLTYCQTIWVSGKMIRTVSRLNNMIQSTFGSAVAMNMESELHRAQDQQHSTHHGNPDSNPETTHTKLPPGQTAQSNSQAAWVGEGTNVPGADMEMAMLSPMGTMMDGSNAFTSGSHGPAAVASSVPALQHAPGDALPVWPPTSMNEEFMALPDWATTDFGFEQAFGGYENGQASTFTGADMCDLDDEWAQLLGEFS